MNILSKKQNRNTYSGGNSLVSKMNSTFFQSKLTINQPNDFYEQEADKVADKVMRMPSGDNLFFPPKSAVSSIIQRKCAHGEEEEDTPQMKGEFSSGAGKAAPPVVSEVISSPGQSLDAGTKQFMESRFGYDFTDVQIHNNSMAHQSSSDIHALAYTHGRHIVFGAGQYRPTTEPGKRLLAHELTHVIQQNGNVRSAIQRSTDAFGKECPESVEIGDKKAIPAFNKAMYDANNRTYFGLVTSMKVGPKDKYESCITEVLKVEENTCGETGNMAGYEPCAPKSHCMKVNDACPGGSCGDALTHTGFSPSPTAFIDLHRTERDKSLLSGTGKTECKVKCLQRYGCGGREIGRFYITRNFKLGEYLDGTTKVPITTGSIEKEPAKK